MQVAANVPDTAHSLKTQMLRQLRLLGEATPAGWEEAVFRVITGGTRKELDWSYPPNREGYSLWIATFGQLAAERGVANVEFRTASAVTADPPDRSAEFPTARCSPWAGWTTHSPP